MVRLMGIRVAVTALLVGAMLWACRPRGEQPVFFSLLFPQLVGMTEATPGEALSAQGEGSVTWR